MLHVDFIPLYKLVYYFSELQVSWAKMGGIALWMLTFRLEPKKMSGRTRFELEDEDAAIGGSLAVRAGRDTIIWREGPVAGKHDKVEFGFGCWG